MSKKLIIGALVTILFSACSTWVSVNPLSPPSKPDKKLEGLWKFESKDNEQVYLHIGKKSENIMVAFGIEHGDDGTLDVEEIPFFITGTDKNKYFNIRYEDLEKNSAVKDKGFIFIKYFFPDDNTLLLYQFDIETIISAVKSGRVKGEISTEKQTVPLLENDKKPIPNSEQTIYHIKITDTSENLLKYFESEGNNVLPEAIKFVRVK